MRCLLLIFAMLAGCAATVDNSDDKSATTSPSESQPEPESLERQLIDRLLSDTNLADLESFERLELVSIPGEAEVYAAICDWDEEWWGTACVFEVEAGRIVKLQELDQTEQSMFRIRCITLEQFPEPLLEAYGKTHMGHGSYYLYRINGSQAELLIDTDAVDFHHDRDVLWGGMLRPLYRDVNDDGYLDVNLSGARKFNDESATVDTRRWEHQETISKTFLYDPATRTFKEDPDLRVGHRYHD